MNDDMMTEGEVVQLLGRERFERLLSGRWLSPFRKGFAQPMYPRHVVELRLDEDLRIFPATRPSAVTKSHGRPNCICSECRACKSCPCAMTCPCATPAGAAKARAPAVVKGHPAERPDFYVTGSGVHDLRQDEPVPLEVLRCWRAFQTRCREVFAL